MPGQGNKNAWTRHCKRLDKATPMPGQGREETGPGTRKALAKALATHSKITSIMFAAISASKPSAQVLSQVVLRIALSGDGYVRRCIRAMPFPSRQQLSLAEEGPSCLQKLLERCRRPPERDVEGYPGRLLHRCGLLGMGKRRRFGVQRP